MIDLHTHSLLSDGDLVPAELIQRARAKGVRAIAITDHVDASNIELVVPALARFVRSLKGHDTIDVIAGMELTHVPPTQIPGLVKKGRQLGAQIVVVHGETIVEPVPPGTNRAAILAGADILAHPGLISPDEVKLAARKGVALEITFRKGHCLTNGHVARLARRHGAKLVLNTDAHSPDDLISIKTAESVAKGAGLEKADFNAMIKNSEELLKKAHRRKTGRSR
jgi:putative hydrolase